jgi:ribulose-phosphate 3-epimerase
MRRPVICPTITAFEPHQFREQMEAVAGFAKRVHIDLMDGMFAPSVSPPLTQVWWPHELKADIHLMYQRPMEHIDQLIKLKPSMVIVHNEAEVHHMHFSAELHRHGIKTGLAILQETPIEWAEQIMHSFDEVLIFSGNLGFHGGRANLELLDKVRFVKHHHPEAKIAWDGGINEHNARLLVEAGVNVLNVGGYIQNSDNPEAAYGKLLEEVRTEK